MKFIKVVSSYYALVSTHDLCWKSLAFFQSCTSDASQAQAFPKLNLPRELASARHHVEMRSFQARLGQHLIQSPKDNFVHRVFSFH
jgi:hypothetical protein